ncbi:MAG: hypothetical protein L3J53_03860 [Proteobacteria bacterium]|nr:hypothetical protein [Pseudomonadota bacterium]
MKPLNEQSLTQQLKELPQKQLPKDMFADIQVGLHKKSYVKRHRFISLASIAAVALMVVVLFSQRQTLDERDYMIEELVKRTVLLEQIVANETPQYTLAGSAITEKIVNMELWLEKLDKDIKQTRDEKILSELMTAKVDILGNLVLLQRKINQKPNYQKVKPYII